MRQNTRQHGRKLVDGFCGLHSLRVNLEVGRLIISTMVIEEIIFGHELSLERLYELHLSSLGLHMVISVVCLTLWGNLVPT